MSEARQTILVISNDALLCAAVRRDLEMRHPEVRVSSGEWHSGGIENHGNRGAERDLAGGRIARLSAEWAT